MKFAHHIFKLIFRNINRSGHTHLTSHIQSVFIYICNNDVSGTSMAGNRCSHDPDRSGSCNQNIFTDQIKRQCRMHGITERVKNSGNFITDKVIKFKGIGSRHNKIFCKTTLSVNSYALRIPAEMLFSRTAVPAVAACQMPFSGVSDGKPIHLITKCFNGTDKFMSRNHWYGDSFLRPLIPIVYMYISTADRSYFNFYKKIIWSILRNRSINHPDPFFSFCLGKCSHKSASDF
jgi:hypothetical protein